MNEIHDASKLPDRRLYVSKIIALHQHTNIGEAILIAQRDMAMQLATKIMEDKAFFQQRSGSMAGYSTLEYTADCVVLTQGEYAELKRQSFKEGLQHAHGFMSYLP